MSPDVWVASARKAESFRSSSHPLSRVHGELIRGHADGPLVAHVHVPLLVELPELGEVLRRGRGVQEPCAQPRSAQACVTQRWTAM